MVEAEAKSLPKETAYAVAFARWAIGEKFVDLIRAIGVKSFKSAHELDKWGNVALHGLLEAIEADILGENLGLSAEMRRLLRIAAFLHDAYKREQVTYLRRVEKGEEKLKMYDISEDLSRSSLNEGLRALGVKKQDREVIIEIIDSVGHASLRKTHDLLEKGWDNLNEFEKAQIIIHVVDDMTGEIKGKTAIIDFNKRMEGLNKAEKYQAMRDARRRILKDFAGADLSAYSQEKLGENALREEELKAFKRQDLDKTPHIYRMQQVVGLRARDVLAKALGLSSEKELKQFLERKLLERQEAHFANPSVLKTQFTPLIS